MSLNFIGNTFLNLIVNVIKFQNNYKFNFLNKNTQFAAHDTFGSYTNSFNNRIYCKNTCT